MARPAKALINLAALRHNYSLAQRLSGQGSAMPIIKANAYGHGIEEVARVLEPLVPAFGVACIEEAIELRQAGIKKPMLLLQGTFSDDELSIVTEENFWLMIGNQHQVESVVNTSLSKPIKVWLKVDTGMSRLGVAPEDVLNTYTRLCESENVQSEIVLATHLSSADELSNCATQEQLRLFDSSIGDLDVPRSLANSAGLLAWPDTRADWNRLGFMLYGHSPVSPSHLCAEASNLKPVMTLLSEVIAVRDVPVGTAVGYGGAWKAERNSLIATVTIGYGDGYPRHAPNGTPVLINGQRAPIVGRVSMDMITVDVTDLENVQIGDEVILWGDDLPLNEIAEWAGTIGYELLTRIPRRTPRIYIDE